MPRLQQLMYASSTALIALLLSQTATASTYYKWVDASGSTHYTETPPPKGLKSHSKKVVVDGAQPMTTAASTTTTATTPTDSNNQPTPAATNTSQAPNNIQVPQVINNGPRSGSLIITQPPQQGLSPSTADPRATFGNPQQSTTTSGGLDKAL